MILPASLLDDVACHRQQPRGELGVLRQLLVVHVHLIKRDVQLVEERALDGPDDVREPLNVLRVVLDTVGEEDRDLLRLHAIARDEIPLHSINRVGEAFLEDVLVVLNDLETDHGRSVWPKCPCLPQLEELPQEVVDGLELVVDAVFDHHDRVVLVGLLEGRHQSACVHKESPLLLTQVGANDHGLHG